MSASYSHCIYSYFYCIFLKDVLHICLNCVAILLCKLYAYWHR
ncbi:hypothetical protein HMPREF1579_00380 [Gardnerella vaginalis JCP8066]|nr:hypothetical protein HMPREF1586_00592 [Gardnerella vaginalis JCP8522]EPI60700.1 hypothetical protein HMPREF1579_00380 [Gardnerella vaginalis JCP8066]